VRVDHHCAIARPSLAIELAEPTDHNQTVLGGELAPLRHRRAVRRLAELPCLGFVGERIAGRAQLREYDEISAGQRPGLDRLGGECAVALQVAEHRRELGADDAEGFG